MHVLKLLCVAVPIGSYTVIEKVELANLVLPLKVEITKFYRFKR